MRDDCKARVLVIDDDPDLLDLMQLVLEMRGYEVVIAADGAEGLTRMEEQMPDLILLDMKMPVMNGWVFAEQCRLRHEKRVPILVMTANTDAKRIATEISADGYVGKPFDVSHLLEAVARWVGPPKR